MTSAFQRSQPDLDRFVAAQDRLYETVVNELRRGRKQMHWIWFIFPQVEGLGVSPIAQYFAIRSRDEAAGYLADPVLGGRLVDCTELVLGNAGKTAHEIFGSPDDIKFRSSMTLFRAIAAQPIFQAALDRFYQGKPDERTLAILTGWGR
jgi:uncharacterized protein (DUF1810 family)